MSIHIDFEWAEVKRSPDVVSQRSMAELCIKVDESIVTRVSTATNACCGTGLSSQCSVLPNGLSTTGGTYFMK